MTHFEETKRNIIGQIERIGVEEFEQLIKVFTGEYSIAESPVDVSEMFQCEYCRELYGECSEDDKNICSKRFKKFMMTEI